jgi:hypothetical protein
MNMRYHHDYPYFGWNGFTVFKHYRPIMGQIIRGQILPLFTRPGKITTRKEPFYKWRGCQHQARGSPRNLPVSDDWQQQQMPDMKAAEIKSKLNGNPRNN